MKKPRKGLLQGSKMVTESIKSTSAKVSIWEVIRSLMGYEVSEHEMTLILKNNSGRKSCGLDWIF